MLCRHLGSKFSYHYFCLTETFELQVHGLNSNQKASLICSQYSKQFRSHYLDFNCLVILQFSSHMLVNLFPTVYRLSLRIKVFPELLCYHFLLSLILPLMMHSLILILQSFIVTESSFQLSGLQDLSSLKLEVSFY